MKAGSILDLGAGGTALFAVQLTCMAHSRTSNNFHVARACLQSKRLVLRVLVHHRDAGRFCRHIVDYGKRRQEGDMEDDPAA